MYETDPMNVNEWRKYIHKMWGCLRKASKSEKRRLLDEIEAVTGLQIDHSHDQWAAEP